MEKLSIAQKKRKNDYLIRDLKGGVKDMDMNKRTVTGLFNSYFYIDNDLDMLLPGAAAKSIAERGVNSRKGNRIKHLKDHSWKDNIARIDVLDEREVEFNGQKLTGIYHESFYPESTDSNDMLIKIQEGLYDARSIGYQYDKIVIAEKESPDEDARRNWDEYLPLAINPEKAEEFGFFWLVKEIYFLEGSDVTFGMNDLTPTLSVKSNNKNAYIDTVTEKLDIISSLFSKGKGLSDDGFYQLKMEELQLRKYLENLKNLKTNFEPSIKDTLKTQSRTEKDTLNNSLVDFYKNLK